MEPKSGRSNRVIERILLHSRAGLRRSIQFGQRSLREWMPGLERGAGDDCGRLSQQYRSAKVKNHVETLESAEEIQFVPRKIDMGEITSPFKGSWMDCSHCEIASCYASFPVLSKMASSTTRSITEHPAGPSDSLQLLYTRPPVYKSLQRHGLDPQATLETSSDLLPPYHCSIALSADFWLKHEKDSPDHSSTDRSWVPLHAELRGTVLMLYLADVPWSTSILSHFKKFKMLRENKFTKPFRSYTLQGGQVGIAADYSKRIFCIRLRVEGEQLLLSARTRATYLEWIEQLTAAINISLPLEKRTMPYHRTTPASSETSLRLRRAIQNEPELFEGLNHTPVHSSDDISSHSAGSGAFCICSCEEHSRPQYVMFYVNRATALAGPQASEKWHPRQSSWSDRLEMEYRQRCLNILEYAAEWPRPWIVRSGQFQHFNEKTELYEPMH